MGNCLVTKLKENVNNDNLSFLDTIIITSPVDATTPAKSNTFELSVGSSLKALRGVFDLYNSSMVLVQSDLNEYTNNTSQPQYVFLKSANGRYALRSKTSGTTTLMNKNSLPVIPYTNWCSVKIDDLNYSKLNNIQLLEVLGTGSLILNKLDLTNSIMLRLQVTGIKTIFDDFIIPVNITVFRISNVKCDISEALLTTAYQMQQLSFQAITADSTVNVDFKNVFDAWHTAGRVSGICYCDTRSTYGLFKLNGESITREFQVNFGTSMVNPTAEDTARGWQIV